MENGIHLTTNRLILREVEESDWTAVHAWDADPEVVRYLTWDCEHTEAATREWVRQQIAQARQQPRLDYAFVITLQEPTQPIGAIDLHLRDDQLSAWVAYRLHPAYRGRGYTTEALRRVLQFGFESLQLHRIKATVHTANVASCRVLEKSGMRYEGVERTWGGQDEPVDEAHYALLEREWATQRTEPAFAATPREVGAVLRTTTRLTTSAGDRQFGLLTARLYLRAFEAADWKLFHTAPFHPVTLSWRHPLSRTAGLDEHAARAYVAGSIRQATEQPRAHYAFVVVRRADDRGIGVISLAVPQASRVGWLDYHLQPAVLRSTDAPAALQAMVHFGFVHRSLHRIGADCWAHDPIAMQILETAGMHQAARFLEAIHVDGAWQSFVSYAAFLEE
jgi:ribosomal-protein-alanine N-acetyltransferase